ncbi:C25 family cysteine peptidase [Geomonas sp. Red276]
MLDLDDGYVAGKPGAPGFPMQLLRVALPPFSDVTDVKAVITKKTEVTKSPKLVAPIQEPRPIHPPSPPKEKHKPSLHAEKRREFAPSPYPRVAPHITPPDIKEYQRALAQPAPVASISTIEHRGVATIASLELRPVHQNEKGILEFATEISITLTYEPTSAPKSGGYFAGSRDFRKARTLKEAARMRDILTGDVLNPDWIGDLPDKFPPFPPFPAKYEYLVITDNQTWNAAAISPAGPAGDLVSSFQKLADWKRRRGLTARVVTISDIVGNTYGDFKTGARDLQEVLRNFLKWAYGHWDVSWVLLGGDVNIVPERLVAGNAEGHIAVDAADPPADNRSFWTGTYLKMHVVSAGDWWPGDWPLLLVNPTTGDLIPYDSAGTSGAATPGWYYTTDNTYATRTATTTQFVRVNGPAAMVNATLQWLYRWNRIPTDLYYSSLVGPNYNVAGRHDWDLIDNGIYGQQTGGTNLDGLGFNADVGLGRAPVASVAEAEAFVKKVIAYEQFRRPDGTTLSHDWPRRLAIVSANFNFNDARMYIGPTAAVPPGNNCYHHPAAALYSLIKLETQFSDVLWNLFSLVTDADIRSIPYDAGAANTGRGWYFAKSDTDLAVSETILVIGGVLTHFPVPTLWVVVYGYSDEVAPQYFIFDKPTADSSMADQETLRKQVAADFPGIDTVRRLYEDEIDLPPADATVPPISHLTTARLRDTLNLGQHFVSLSGHGSQGGCCGLDSGMALGLANGYHTFIGYAFSCLTGDFEWEDAMSESLLKNTNGGAVAYIGYTRFGWSGDAGYQREFFKRLKTTRHLALLNDSRFNLQNKWSNVALNLLGDPEMPLWIGDPKTLAVTHPSKVTRSDQHVLVKVAQSGGGAVADAVVSFAMGDWVVSATTDATGEADLHIDPPAKGAMEVVVTATDYVPYFGSIQVTEVICKTGVVCKAAISCKAAVGCKAAIFCKSNILCNASILCGPAISCGAEIIPCGGKIACNISISGCMAAIGSGCPAIDPPPWDEDFVDIVKEAGVKDIRELAAKRDTPAVKRLIEKLSPANRKALILMLKEMDTE